MPNRLSTERFVGLLRDHLQQMAQDTKTYRLPDGVISVRRFDTLEDARLIVTTADGSQFALRISRHR